MDVAKMFEDMNDLQHNLSENKRKKLLDLDEHYNSFNSDFSCGEIVIDSTEEINSIKPMQKLINLLRKSSERLDLNILHLFAKQSNIKISVNIPTSLV